jgi:tRNA(Arg) A34 adenosine deaminase TadA
MCGVLIEGLKILNPGRRVAILRTFVRTDNHSRRLNKTMKEDFMRKAIALSVENVQKGGGPFGAVIVKGDEIVATGVNRVTSNCDPTAHAEVSAIREASRKLGTFDLSGCEIYTSCEPCPMCLGAIYWAHLDRMYYGNTKEDAKEIGFDDSFIYKELELSPSLRRLISVPLMRDEALQAFRDWRDKTDKVEY